MSKDNSIIFSQKVKALDFTKAISFHQYQHPMLTVHRYTLANHDAVSIFGEHALLHRRGAVYVIKCKYRSQNCPLIVCFTLHAGDCFYLFSRLNLITAKVTAFQYIIVLGTYKFACLNC